MSLTSNLHSPTHSSLKGDRPIFSGDDEKILIKKIVLLGDSITQFSETEIIDRITQDSLMIETVSEAVGGTTIAAWADTGPSGYIQAVRPTYASDTNVLFYINLGTNDATFPVSGDQTALLAQMESDMRTLVGQIEDDGHMVALSRLHYREDDPAIAADEDVGTKYFNDNLFDDLIAELSPDWFDTITNIPVLDMYTLTKANEATWLDAGKVHPTQTGQDGIADILYDGFNTAIIRTLTPLSTGVIVVQTGSGAATNAGINDTNRVNIWDMVDSLGVSQPDIAFQLTDFPSSTGSGKGNPADPTNTTASIENHAMALDSNFNNGTVDTFIGLHGCLAGATGTFKAIASHSNFGDIKFTIGASDDTIAGSAAQPEIASVPFTVDANGSIKITISPITGIYSAISGCEITFD